jgi:hypothetical protein
MELKCASEGGGCVYTTLLGDINAVYSAASPPVFLAQWLCVSGPLHPPVGFPCKGRSSKNYGQVEDLLLFGKKREQIIKVSKILRFLWLLTQCSSVCFYGESVLLSLFFYAYLKKRRFSESMVFFFLPHSIYSIFCNKQFHIRNCRSIKKYQKFLQFI